MNLYAYVTTRKMGDIFLPVPAQNSVLREIARRLDLNYILPRVEHFYENSFIELNTLLKQAEKESIIGMYSFLMLPLDIKKLKNINELLAERNLRIFFALENRFFENIEDIKNIYISHLLKKMQSQNSPTFREIKDNERTKIT